MSKIVCSLASWPPRIKYVAACVKSLLDQSVKPDEVNVNLSLMEFPHGVCDLPEELQDLEGRPDVCINWETGNTFVFRKEIPVVKKYYGTDTIMLSVDDDIRYDHGYVERIVRDLGDSDAFNTDPGVVGFKHASRLDKFTPEFWEALTDDVIKCGISDTWHAYYLEKIGAKRDYGRPDPELDKMCHAVAANVSPNSERIGGYTRERIVLADKLTRKALGLPEVTY